MKEDEMQTLYDRFPFDDSNWIDVPVSMQNQQHQQQQQQLQQ